MPRPRRLWLLGAALALGLAAPVAAQEGALLSGSPRHARQPLFARTELAGRVFFDVDGDGSPRPGEPGISGVVVALPGGLYAVTDARGRFQLRELVPGRTVVVVDGSSLPAGGLAPEPLVVELPPGGLVALELPVRGRLTLETIGSDEVTGFQAVPKLTELPISVAGNSSDFKVLANGVAVPFPRVELELVGLSRGELAGPGAAITLRPRLLGATGEPTGYSWEVITPDTTRVASGKGDGPLPDAIRWDGRTEGGAHAGPGAAHAARVCVELSGGDAACSPYRLFGVRGARGERPRLARPGIEPFAVVGGAPATVDRDGSFLKGASVPADRIVRFELHGADGRVALGQLRFPALGVARTAPFPVRFGVESDGLRVDPAAPDQLLVPVTGSVTADTRSVRSGALELPLRAGTFSLELPLSRGKNRAEFTLSGDSSVTTVYELSTVVEDRTASGRPIVVVPGVPSLTLEAPEAGAGAGPSRQSLLRGSAEPGSVVTVDGRRLPLADDGSFAAVVPVGADGAVAVKVFDPRGGRTGELRRALGAASSRLSVTAFGDLAPAASVPLAAGSATGALLLGGGQASGRFLGEGLRATVGLGATPVAPTALLGDGLVALEAPLGRFRAGLRVQTAVLRDLEEAAPGEARAGAAQGLLLEARASAALRGEAFLAFVDAGLEQENLEHLDRSEDDPTRVFVRSLASVGVGGAVALGPGLDLSLRLAAGAALGATTADGAPVELAFPERFDGYAGLLWRPGGRAALLARYSLSREEGSFEPAPGVAGASLEHVVGAALDLPLGQATLRQGLALRLRSHGDGPLDGTPYELTRLELHPAESVLLATDYRLLLVPDAPVHHLGVELSFRLAAGVWLGAALEGTHGPGFPEELLALVRLQGFFDSAH